MNKGKNINKTNSNIHSSKNTYVPINNKNKEKKEIENYRTILFTYYKNPSILQIDNKSEFNYIGIPNTYGYTNNQYDYSIDNHSNENIYEENSYDSYEKYGKYRTYLDESNELVYYTDKKLYNYRKNELVQNFDYNSIGFANIGNTCYMNAFLQILLHTPNFLKNLRKYKSNNPGTLLYNLLYLSLYPYNTDYLYKIKEIMKEIKSEYGAFIPGDSQVFAIDFLDKLIYEIKGKDYSDDSFDSNNDDNKISKIEKYALFIKDINKNKNIFEKIFQFCEVTKGSDNNKFFFSVNLNIDLTFPKNKNAYISLAELLNEKYQVNGNINGNYGLDNNRVKTSKIADLPQVLIISFARSVSGKNIIKATVSFPEILEVDSYIDPELKKYNNISCTKYILYAVNERYGQSKSQGHYVCYIKIKNANWYRFSDYYVHPSKPDLNSDDVYGLYYIRKDCI